MQAVLSRSPVGTKEAESAAFAHVCSRVQGTAGLAAHVHARPRLALAVVAAVLHIAQRQPASALAAQGQTVPAVYAAPVLAKAAA